MEISILRGRRVRLLNISKISGHHAVVTQVVERKQFSRLCSVVQWKYLRSQILDSSKKIGFRVINSFDRIGNTVKQLLKARV